MVEKLTDKSSLGPNVRKLLLEFIATETMKAASGGGAGAVAAEILNIRHHARTAFNKLAENLYALRMAPDWPGWDDEQAAEQILHRLELRKAEKT